MSFRIHFGSSTPGESSLEETTVPDDGYTVVPGNRNIDYSSSASPYAPRQYSQAGNYTGRTLVPQTIDDMIGPEPMWPDSCTATYASRLSTYKSRPASVRSTSSTSTRSTMSLSGILPPSWPLTPDLPNPREDDELIPTPCLFSNILGVNCPTHSKFDEWYAHIMSHFGASGPPGKALCLFCQRSFHDDEDPEIGTCWVEYCGHVRDHIRNGKEVDETRPDFETWAYLRDIGVLDAERYAAVCERYTERPTDLFSWLKLKDWASPEMEARQQDRASAKDRFKRQRTETSSRRNKDIGGSSRNTSTRTHVSRSSVKDKNVEQIDRNWKRQEMTENDPSSSSFLTASRMRPYVTNVGHNLNTPTQPRSYQVESLQERNENPRDVNSKEYDPYTSLQMLDEEMKLPHLSAETSPVDAYASSVTEKEEIVEFPEKESKGKGISWFVDERQSIASSKEADVQPLVKKSTSRAGGLPSPGSDFSILVGEPRRASIECDDDLPAGDNTTSGLLNTQPNQEHSVPLDMHEIIGEEQTLHISGSELSVPKAHNTTVRRRHRRRITNAASGAELDPLLPRRPSLSSSATSSNVDWHYAGLVPPSPNTVIFSKDYTGETPIDADGNPPRSSISSPLRVSRTNASAVSSNTTQGSSPIDNGDDSLPPASLSSSQPPPTPPGDGTLSPITSKTKTQWVLDLLSCPEAIMFYIEVIQVCAISFHVTATTIYFRDPYARGVGKFSDSDFLNLVSAALVQNMGLALSLIGMRKRNDESLLIWSVTVAISSFLLSIASLGLYFVYTTFGNLFMGLAAVCQLWIWKFVVFGSRAQRSIPGSVRRASLSSESDLEMQMQQVSRR